jgi:hypothetical protein
MSEVTAVHIMLEMLRFMANVVQYMAIHAGMDSLQEIAFLDDGDVDSLIKHVNRPGGTTTVGTGPDEVTTPNIGFTVSIRTDANLKWCVFYLKNQMILTHTHNMADIYLELVFEFRDQKKWEENSTKNAVETMINDKD